MEYPWTNSVVNLAQTWTCVWLSMCSVFDLLTSHGCWLSSIVCGHQVVLVGFLLLALKSLPTLRPQKHFDVFQEDRERFSFTFFHILHSNYWKKLKAKTFIYTIHTAGLYLGIFGILSIPICGRVWKFYLTTRFSGISQIKLIFCFQHFLMVGTQVFGRYPLHWRMYSKWIARQSVKWQSIAIPWVQIALYTRLMEKLPCEKFMLTLNSRVLHPGHSVQMSCSILLTVVQTYQQLNFMCFVWFYNTLHGVVHAALKIHLKV